jgi:glycosyltransferase involved in cell wall biosynthesis
VVNQTVQADEVIIVDNNSTDDTFTKVQGFIDDYEREHPDRRGQLILVEQNEEQGLVPTRNFGLDMAKCELLGRIDSDAILAPEWVEVIKKNFADDPDMMGATGPVSYYDMPMRRLSFNSDRTVRKLIQKNADVIPMFFGTNMCMRKSAWQVVREEACIDKEDILHEDIDLSVHFSLNGLKVKYLQDMVAGMSARRIEDKLKDFRAYQQRMLTTFTVHGIEPTSGAKAARLFFLAVWFPLHALRPAYTKRFEKLKDEYLTEMWNDTGKMAPLKDRVLAKLDAAVAKELHH